MKVLIVDNEKEVRELLKGIILSIAPGEFIIEEAEGVETGVMKINEYKPDIVFLDVEMNDGTGFDLMSKIPNPAFQLIFTTAHNKYAIQAFKCSAIDYLLKPVDFDELETALQKAKNDNDKSLLNKKLYNLKKKSNC